MGAMGLTNAYAQNQNPTEYYTLQEIQQDPSRLDRMPQLTGQQRTVMQSYQQQLNNPMQRFVRPFRTPGQFLFIPGVGSVEDVVP